jgi:hypothetical protein
VAKWDGIEPRSNLNVGVGNACGLPHGRRS